MQKKKVNAEFEIDLNEKFKDYEDMIKRKAEEKNELETKALGIRDRIQQKKE